jgi:Flp pilus assembly CpaF family ATPase
MQETKKTLKERKEIERKLGFTVKHFPPEKKRKIIEEREETELIEDTDRELIYLITAIPEFSLQEAEITKEIVEEIQKKENKIRKEEIQKEIDVYCKNEWIKLKDRQNTYIKKAIESIVFGFGAMDFILKDNSIEEISAIGAQKNVFVFKKNFGWIKTNLLYLIEENIVNLANKMSRTIGRRLTLQNPKLNSVLPNGERINAIMPPITASPALTIRKFNEKPLTPIELIENKTFSPELMAFLWLALQTETSIIIAGNTGSGKTTSMNALFSFVDEKERIVVTEETPEICLPQEHTIKLNTAENLGIEMQELITNTLRMRPDRIIVGEIREKKEAKAFIDTLLAGQGKGSYATFHALTGKECLTRMKNLGLMETDLSAVDLILVQKRWNSIDIKRGIKKEERHIIEASEIISEEGKNKLNILFEFNFRKKKLTKKNESQRIKNKIKQCFSLNEKEYKKEIKKRKLLLERMKGKNLSIKEFHKTISK